MSTLYYRAQLVLRGTKLVHSILIDNTTIDMAMNVFNQTTPGMNMEVQVIQFGTGDVVASKQSTLTEREWFIAKLDQFKTAWHELSNAWENLDRNDFDIANNGPEDLYPFDASFDDLVIPVIWWVNDVKQRFDCITHYRGYELRTYPNGNATSTIVYKDGELALGCSFGIVGIEDSLEKAKGKIDKQLDGE